MLADLTRAPQLSAFPLPLPEDLQSLSQTAAPQLRPAPCSVGSGRGMRSRGRAGPASDQRPRPKAALGTRPGLCQPHTLVKLG